jgi:hypothetical protein
LLDGGGLLLVHFTALVQQQFPDLVSFQVLDFDLVVHADLLVQVGVGRAWKTSASYGAVLQRFPAETLVPVRQFVTISGEDSGCGLRATRPSCQFRSENLEQIREP